MRLLGVVRQWPDSKTRGVLLHICDCIIHSLTMLSRFSAYLISQELLQAGEVLTVSCMLSLCVYLVSQKHCTTIYTLWFCGWEILMYFMSWSALTKLKVRWAIAIAWTFNKPHLPKTRPRCYARLPTAFCPFCKTITCSNSDSSHIPNSEG